jgi:hypothetical protein
MIASGKWIQKAEWNRWVTTMEWEIKIFVERGEQPHTTPVTSTWTSDFLTREGEGPKEVR